MRRTLGVVALALVACGDPEGGRASQGRSASAVAPAEQPSPARAELAAPSPPPASSSPILRLHPIPEEALAVARGDLVAPRTLAAAQLARDGQRVIWIVDATSVRLEGWARARSAAGR